MTGKAIQTAERPGNGGLLVLSAPLFLFTCLAVGMGLLLGEWTSRGGDVVLPHVAVILSMTAVLYAVALAMSRRRRRVAQIVVTAIAVTLTTVLVSFYVLTMLSLVFMKELMTRQLVMGYARDLPALLAALPISSTVIVAGLLAVIALGISLGLAVAWCLTSSVGLTRVASHRFAGFATRTLLYGGVLHLLVGFSIPLGWYVFNAEPIMASWHNTRLGTAERYGHRDPVVEALERRITETYPAAPAGTRANVILVYVDALRADVTQPYGAERRNMPFVSSLVESGQLAQVDLALAACPATLCGLGTLLQSRPLPLLHTQNFSLPALLSRQGYRTAYVLSSNHQDFMELREYYRPSDFYVDGKDLSTTRQTDDYFVLDGLKRLGAWDGRPTFLMIGLVSTHLSGARNDRNRVYTPDRISLLAAKEDYKITYRNNYDNGVVQADDVLRQIWDWLKSNGYLDHAVVVITSDHGEFLGERGTYSHGQSLYQPELHIPLWVSPALTAGAATPFARQLDVAPTIVDGLGLAVPSTWTGLPIRTLHQAVQWSEHYLPSSMGTVAIVRREGSVTLKYIEARSATYEAVYDIGADPQEANNLLQFLPQSLVEEFRARARRALATK